MQLCLPIALSANRPLVPLEAIMFLADRDEDYIMSAIQCGAIAWAWDIRSPDAERCEVRAWAPCVMDWLELAEEHRQTPIANRKSQIKNEDEVLAALFPHSRAELKATELKRMFTCGHQHVLHLIAAGEFGKPLTAANTGPNGSPRVPRPPIIAWLKTRRIL